MHKFLIKDATGFSRDFGAPAAAAAFAKKTIGRDAVCARKGKDVLWMSAAHTEYFLEIEGEFHVVNTALAILDGKSAQLDQARATSNAVLIQRAGAEAVRVSHPKFGLGTVIKQDDKAATVIFDTQKKPMRMVASMLSQA